MQRSSKTGNGITKTGNGIDQTGNGIISPIFLPRNKKLILQNVLHFYQGFQSQYLKQEMELSKQEMELFEVIIATLGSILDSQLS